MKDAVYELILTSSEVGAIKAALDATAEAPQHPGTNPFEAEDYSSAYDKIAALLDYVQADRAAEIAEAAYKETLENVRDAYKKEAF